MLRITRVALDAANRMMPADNVIQLLVNNSDGKGHAYGSHLNFLLSAQAFANLFHRKMHHLLCLAAFQVSSIIYTGQGKVGAENGASPVAFQISQRADFFETLTGPQTMYERPIVNSRDEPLCGTLGGRRDGTGFSRLHCIFHDNTLSHVATFLKVGTMQIFLAMLEAEELDPRLILDDPVDAVHRWSHDPSLRISARLVGGGEITALDLQRRFLDNARRFVAAGGCNGVVPDAEEIVDLWDETLRLLQAGEVAKLARRLDWVLKLSILHQAIMRRPELTWTSPGIKHLDDLYGSLDAAEGLYWLHERLGGVDRIATEEQIEYFVHQPPKDTRAWTRAMLLRAAAPTDIESVDWDALRFRIVGADQWPEHRTVHLDDPLGFTADEMGDVFEDTTDLVEILDRLESKCGRMQAP
jgi:proteasome accessory factor A